MTTRVLTRARLAARGTGLVVMIGMVLAATPIHAADSGPTTTDDNICMQRVFGFPVTPTNKLNCTANDIKLSGVDEMSISPKNCTKGEEFTLTAIFTTEVTANERYDAGFFFRIDGGATARGDLPGATGQCSLSALTPSEPPPPSPADLDGDTCADLNSGVYMLEFTIPGVKCNDSDNDGKLNLPYCTSWHSKKGTFCSTELPPDDELEDDLLFDGDEAPFFRPDTKSKCVCDDTFQVPVIVEDAELTVTKTADPTEVFEPGDIVQYTVEITNTSNFSSVAIDTIVDDKFGDLLELEEPNIKLLTNDCDDLANATLGPGDVEICVFTAEVTGNAGFVHTNIVTVTGTQLDKDNTVEASDDADVTVENVVTTPVITKSVSSCQAASVDMNYQVMIVNPTPSDPLTVDSLVDDKFGDITETHLAGGGFEQVVSTTCATGQVITGTPYVCSFRGRITDDDCDFTHVNTVTGTVTDDGSPVEAQSNAATVDLSVVSSPLTVP